MMDGAIVCPSSVFIGCRQSKILNSTLRQDNRQSTIDRPNKSIFSQDDTLNIIINNIIVVDLIDFLEYRYLIDCSIISKASDTKETWIQESVKR
jgi:hypothetical protein